MTWIALEASDGHRFRAWQEAPADAPHGVLVVLQEIFGVNAHIRELCKRYAGDGWLAIAPALFDRAGERLEDMAYGAQDAALGVELKAKVPTDKAMLDVQAAVIHAGHVHAPVAVVGFCWGGTLAWLAASRLAGVSAAVAYYGTAIAANVRETPGVPMLLHFGELDTHIPPEHVAAIARAHPGIELHRYPAGHGFNCDARPSFHRQSAELSGALTQQFLREILSN